jgi:hypothetical protein
MSDLRISDRGSNLLQNSKSRLRYRGREIRGREGNGGHAQRGERAPLYDRPYRTGGYDVSVAG